MRRIAYRSATILLLLIGLGLLPLTNAGLLSFDTPYIHRLSPGLPPADRLVAFVNVNVIPMDNESILPGQTVVVRDGVIETIGDTSQVKVPDGARVIDGAGKYLMPGLVDMHVHIQDESDMLLLVANGVTSVRNMWGNAGKALALGSPDQLALRKAIQRGELLGPTIYTTGPIMEGDPPTSPLMDVFRSPAEAEESVARQAAQGYDFVKVYDHLDAETYRAILRAAEAHGLPVVGHAPEAVSLEAVLSGGQVTIEHLTGYLDPDTAEFVIPEGQIEAYATRTREAGVWNTPTIGVYQKNMVSPERLQQLENQPGMQYISPGMRALNRFFYRQMSQGHTYSGQDYPARIAALDLRMTRALHEAGARILLGTDSSNPYHLLGYAAHEELGYLVEADLSPYEALRAGTYDAAYVLGKLDEFGTVAEGKRADLILLEANPLEDVADANKRAGVMLRGRWFTESELQAMLAGLADSFAPTLPERVWPLVVIALAVFLIGGSFRTAGIP